MPELYCIIHTFIKNYKKRRNRVGSRLFQVCAKNSLVSVVYNIHYFFGRFIQP